MSNTTSLRELAAEFGMQVHEVAASLDVRDYDTDDHVIDWADEARAALTQQAQIADTL